MEARNKTSVAELDLMKLIRGQRTKCIPFWEVWFAMDDFLARRYNSDLVAAALDLGWRAICLGGVNSQVGFGYSETASDGTSHYSGGALRSLSQLEEQPLPNWGPLITELREKRQVAHEVGL